MIADNAVQHTRPVGRDLLMTPPRHPRNPAVRRPPGWRPRAEPPRSTHDHERGCCPTPQRRRRPAGVVRTPTCPRLGCRDPLVGAPVGRDRCPIHQLHRRRLRRPPRNARRPRSPCGRVLGNVLLLRNRKPPPRRTRPPHHLHGRTPLTFVAISAGTRTCN